MVGLEQSSGKMTVGGVQRVTAETPRLRTILIETHGALRVSA
jgi:hypothetical protein